MKRFLKICMWTVLILVILVSALFVYVRSVASLDDPSFAVSHIDTKEVVEKNGLRTLGNNWFRKSESGLYEMYVEGDGYERGIAIGKLSKDLIQYQEEVFNNQIRQLVPSDTYLNFLKYVVGWFNRDLDEHVKEEYRQEIYGVSRVASSEFDYIAPPYQRMLNYHAAHDIGHALQNLALVGCTAFATWDEASEDSTLIVARNFDFYVGDDFAKNKIVAFYKPSEGHSFMMVTFGGMTGVLSGMNTQGLTITLNAAKSEIPFGSATPVSLLAREILQYAASIDEAVAIAKKYDTFVAESFLVGSARDNKAVVIEKTPTAFGLYAPEGNRLVTTNHFQSPELKDTELNREHMQTSASVYRYERVEELLTAAGTNSVVKAVSILRDQKGKNDVDIGLGNEKSINQLIAHHGIVFQPGKQKVWISTAPFQLGKFVCYDLTEVFESGMTGNHEVQDSTQTIALDPFVQTSTFADALAFNRYRFPFQPKKEFNPDSLVAWNPESYLTYMLAGDYAMESENYERAIFFYDEGLKREVATLHERQHMERALEKAKRLSE